LWKKGFKRVACLDEVGRGCLAGPVVAAAVLILNTKYKIPRSRASSLPGRLSIKIKDSKQLAAKKREEFYKVLIKGAPSKTGRVVGTRELPAKRELPSLGGWPLAIEWGVGRVSEKIIDKINILEATKLAMIKALQNLKKRFKGSVRKSRCSGIFCGSDFLILDGNFTLPTLQLAKAGIKKSIPQKSIVKADEKVFSCAAASIIAKVIRDRIMMKCHKKYPRYRFDLHKGYATKLHRKLVKKYGPCKIHRKSFRPINIAK